ncbi:hypothetical protein BGZ73_001910, partial [Actinomortierella ambigua]
IEIDTPDAGDSPDEAADNKPGLPKRGRLVYTKRLRCPRKAGRFPHKRLHWIDQQIRDTSERRYTVEHLQEQQTKIFEQILWEQNVKYFGQMLDGLIVQFLRTNNENATTLAIMLDISSPKPTRRKPNRRQH